VAFLCLPYFKNEWIVMSYFNKFSIKLLLVMVFLTITPRAFAEVFDPCSGATGDLLARCSEIYATNGGSGNVPVFNDNQIIEIIETIKPKQIAAQGTTTISFASQQLQILHNRIISLKPGKGKENRFSLSGFTMTDSFGREIPIGQMAENILYNAPDDGSGEDPLRDNRLGVYIKGQLSNGDKAVTTTESGFDIDFKSITLGFDYQFTDELILGIATGYGQSDVDFDSNGGKMENDTQSISAYGSYLLPKDFYVDGVVNYATNDYDNTRTIAYQAFQTSATSDTSGDQYGISLGLGKDFYVDSLFISPYVRTEYLAVNIDAYTEQGGAGYALNVDKQDISSLTSSVGAQVSRTFSVPWGLVSPGMRFEWQHQYRDDQRIINGQFVEALPGAGSFAISTESPDRDYFNLEASVDVTLPSGQVAYLRYETRLGQNDITNHTIDVFVRMQF
jgi:uncharacterized protein YhjY with autotransporter beta-barrel domain